MLDENSAEYVHRRMIARLNTVIDTGKSAVADSIADDDVSTTLRNKLDDAVLVLVNNTIRACGVEVGDAMSEEHSGMLETVVEQDLRADRQRRARQQGAGTGDREVEQERLDRIARVARQCGGSEKKRPRSRRSSQRDGEARGGAPVLWGMAWTSSPRRACRRAVEDQAQGRRVGDARGRRRGSATVEGRRCAWLDEVRGRRTARNITPSRTTCAWTRTTSTTHSRTGRRCGRRGRSRGCSRSRMKT